MPEIQEISINYSYKPPMPVARGKPVDLSRLAHTHSTEIDIDDANQYKELDRQKPDLHARARALAAQYGCSHYRVVSRERLFGDAGGSFVFNRYYLFFFKDKV